MTGKVALVIGASSGIGEAAARLLARKARTSCWWRDAANASISSAIEGDKEMAPAQCLQDRQTRSRLVARALHEWLPAQRPRMTDGTATALAFDYSLKRRIALTKYLDDAALPVDNNFDEQQISPWALDARTDCSTRR